jgi:hypothetical protein
MAAGYLPWLPYLQAVSRIKAFWAPLVPVTFVSDYFFEYFGNMKFLKPILLLLLSVYLFKVLYAEKKLNSNPAKSNPLWFSFIVLSVWIVVTYLIPYLRSLLVVPMLYPRYTIVVLPAFLIAIAYGIELIRFKALKIFVLSAFIIVSLTTLLFSRKYYSQVSKTQFREMTEFVVENNKQNYPIIDELVSWQHQYYFKALKFKPTILEGSKLNVIDSILAGKNQKYIVKGFWIVGAHGEQPLTTEQKTALDTSFVMTMEKKFFDAWAELYIRGKNQFTKTHKINTSKEPVVRHSLEK